MSLPILKDWWIPHLAYTQWQNLSVLQLANFTGIFGIIFAILFSNALLAYLWIRNLKKIAIFFVLILFTSFSIGNLYIQKKTEKDIQKFNFIGIQSSPENGFYSDANENDIITLKKLTQEALQKVENRKKITFVLWPENMIEKKYTEELLSFAIENNIYLVFDRAEKSQESLFNTVVMISPDGEEILKNYKTHKAPGEKIETKKEVHNSIIIDNIKMTSDICYDLHYSDVSKRVKNNDLLFVPVDDDRFGNFMPYLHAKDIIFRAIENRIDIFAASTNGPTMYVNKYGMIKSGPLKIYDENYLILQVK